MKIDIDNIRQQNADYQSRFNAEFEEVYKQSFKSYANDTKLYIQSRILNPYGQKKAETALREYENRIKHIKSLIEQ